MRHLFRIPNQLFRIPKRQLQIPFNFNDVYQLGQAGVGIFNIRAIKGQQDGIGIIKVEQETTSEETVFVQ